MYVQLQFREQSREIKVQLQLQRRTKSKSTADSHMFLKTKVIILSLSFLQYMPLISSKIDTLLVMSIIKIFIQPLQQTCHVAKITIIEIIITNLQPPPPPLLLLLLQEQGTRDNIIIAPMSLLIINQLVNSDNHSFTSRE